MDLNTRFNVLVQGVEVSQKSGILSLDDAFNAKNAINEITNGENIKENIKILIDICEKAQKNGIFSIQDAHFIYSACEDIDTEIDKFIAKKASNNDTNSKQSDEVDEVNEKTNNE